MNKSKNILLYIVFVLCMVVSIDKTNAVYIGDAGDPGSYPASGACPTTSLCMSKTHKTVKITVYYINNGSFEEKIGKSAIWSSNSDIYNKFSEVDPVPNNIFTSNSSWATVNQKLIEYFGMSKQDYNANPTAEMKAFFQKYIGADYQSRFTKVSEFANDKKAATKGYRIIIEPVLYTTVGAPKDGKPPRLYTIKEYAEAIKDQNPRSNCMFSSPAQTCSKPFGGGVSSGGYSGGAMSYLYVDTRDVGISKETKESCSVRSAEAGYQLANEVAKNSNGCGFQILDISSFVRSCYSSSVKEISELKCTNTDQNNIGEYSEIYTKKSSCEGATEEEEKATEFGKLYKEVNKCKIYCIESASVSFPGHRSGDTSINKSDKGAYFAWPTKTSLGMYNMSMTSTFTCRIKKDGGSCNSDDIDQLKSAVETGYLNKSTFKASLQAGTNKIINEQLVQYNSKTNNKTNVAWEDETISKPIVFQKTTNFKINDNTNRYYNKVTDAVSSQKQSGNIIFDRGEGVVSLSDKDSTSKTYDLIIKNVTLGMSNKFGKLVGTYTCHYNLRTSGDTPCVCPPGTLNEGESLANDACLNSKDNKEPCSELIQEYCNKPKSEWPDSCKDTCVDSNGTKIDLDACTTTQQKQQNISATAAKAWCTEKFCSQCTDSKGKTWNLTGCMAKGNSYASCKKQYCPTVGTCSGKCEWESETNPYGSTMSILYCGDKKEPCNTDFHCPGGDTEDMDPTACVQAKSGYTNLNYALSQGWITKTQLKQYLDECEEVVCPYGKKIIYRVIDLDNPFPGKKVSGKYNNFSNNGVKSRKPGYNWLSEKLVSSKILKARGVSGYNLYKKEPLVTITLTPNDIKNIRTYNKTNNYSDFNLNCLNDNKTAYCTSNFLRKEKRNIVTKYISSCSSITNPEQFDKCYNSNN